MSDRLLQVNREPLKVVPDGVRQVWESRPEHRCYHEDGRGRCSRYDTTPYRWTTPGGRAAVDYYCATHLAKLRRAGVSREAVAGLAVVDGDTT